MGQKNKLCEGKRSRGRPIIKFIDSLNTHLTKNIMKNAELTRRIPNREVRRAMVIDVCSKRDHEEEKCNLVCLRLTVLFALLL